MKIPIETVTTWFLRFMIAMAIIGIMCFTTALGVRASVVIAGDPEFKFAAIVGMPCDVLMIALFGFFLRLVWKEYKEFG